MPAECYYMFTLNNYTPLELQVLRDLHEINVRYVCWQREVAPTTGTPHLQGYIELKSKKGHAWLRGIGFPNRTHFEGRRGTRVEAREYCKKPETAVADSFEEFGTWVAGGGARSDIDALVERVRAGAGDHELLDEMPGTFFRHMKAVKELRSVILPERDRSVQPVVKVFWGVTQSGKTRSVYDWADEQGYKVFSLTAGRWWDGYKQQKVCLLDDFSTEFGRTLGGIHFLLKLLGRYPMTVEVKGSTVPFNSPYIFLTSNQDPRDWYPEAIQEHQDALRARFSEVRHFPGALEMFHAHAVEPAVHAGVVPPIMIDLTQD